MGARKSAKSWSVHTFGRLLRLLRHFTSSSTAPALRGGALWALVAVLGLGPSAGRAQVALEQFKPAPLATDGFALSRPNVLDGGGWDLLVVFDYALSPLEFERTTRGVTREERVVQHHLVGHAGAGVAIADRVALFFSVPVHILMEGDDPDDFTNAAPPPDDAGLGDVAVGARLRIAGEADDVAALGLELIGRLPTAKLANEDQQYSGDEIGSYESALLGELRLGGFDVQLRAGARLRRQYRFADLVLGHELLLGLGARLQVAGQFYLHAEAYGSTQVKDPFDQDSTPLEVIGGPKVRAGAVVFGVAGGTALMRGYGSPDLRVIASFGVAPLPKKPPERAPEPELPRDSDEDGFLDQIDRCPRQAEDKDDHDDGDGCPDPDNDGDGVLDAHDRCAIDAEDEDGFEDTDGCPDLDNDGDELADGDDECPSEAEDKDTFKDSDGCPDPDNDGDGVLDTDDDCPLAPGPAGGSGCPKSVRFDADKGVITILDKVEFASGKDRLLPSSFPILQEVQSTLTANPQVQRLRIEGHTDSAGRARKNLELSKRRARSVARWLISAGVPSERLEAWGCGQTRPIADNRDRNGRAQNRRVEFHVSDPPPPVPTPSDGCQRIAF